MRTEEKEKKGGSKTSHCNKKKRGHRESEEEGELLESNYRTESFSEFSSTRSSSSEEAFTEDEKSMVKRA